MAAFTNRRFAPLKEDLNKRDLHLPKLKGVIFDVDGTLWFVKKFYRLSCSFSCAPLLSISSNLKPENLYLIYNGIYCLQLYNCIIV